MRRAWAYLAGSGGDADDNAEADSATDKKGFVSTGDEYETNAGDQQKQHKQGTSDDDGSPAVAPSSADGIDGNDHHVQPDESKTRAEESDTAGVLPIGDDGAAPAAAVDESPEAVSYASKGGTNHASDDEGDGTSIAGAIDNNQEKQTELEPSAASNPPPAAASSGLGLGLASAAAFQLVANAETPQRAERIVDVDAAGAAATAGVADATEGAVRYDASSEAPPTTGQSSLLEQSWDPMASTSTEEETADIYDDDDDDDDRDDDNVDVMDGAIATNSTGIGPSPPQSNGASSFGEPPTPIVGNRSSRNDQEGSGGKFVAENKEEDALVGSDLSIPVIVDPNAAPPASNGSSAKSNDNAKKGWSFFGMLKSAEEGGGADGEISVLTDVKSVVKEDKKVDGSGDGPEEGAHKSPPAHTFQEKDTVGASKAPEQQQAPKEAPPSPSPVAPNSDAVVDAIPPGIGTEDDYASEVDLDEFDGSVDRDNGGDNASKSSQTSPPPSPKRQELTNELLANLMADVADDEGDGSIVPIKMVQPPSKGDGEEDNADGHGQDDKAAVADEEVEVSSTGVLEVDADEVFGLHESLNGSKRNLVASGADEQTGGTVSADDQGPSADVDADQNDYGDDFEGVEDELLESFRDSKAAPAKPEKPRTRPDEVIIDPRALARGFGAPAQERNNRRHLKTLEEDDEDEERRAVRDGASPTPDEMGHVEPHPNQELFDIIDRNFESFSPQGDPLGEDQKRYLTTEDVRLCFVAFVAIFSPPPITALAEEYNHSLDDDLAAEREELERQRAALDRSGSGHGESNGGGRQQHGYDDEGEVGVDDDDNNARRRPHVPMDLVVALWEEVLRTVGDEGTLKPGTDGVSAAKDGQYSPAISYVRDALVSLGLVDVVSGSTVGRDNGMHSIHLEDEDGFFGKVLGGFRNDKGRGESRQRGSVETMVVHQSINQQYGEYLADEHHCYEFPQIVAEYRRRWSKAVVKCSMTEGGEWSEFTSGYDLHTLPWNLTCTSMFDECAALMRDQRYVIRRLEEVGVLDGTTAHVTDVDELLRTICEQWEDYNGTVDWKAFILETYGHIKAYAASLLKSNEDAANAAARGDGNISASFDADELDSSDASRLLEAGRALHLIGVSLGTHGYVDEEIEYYLESLRFKEATPDGDDRVDYSDTLHCLGFAYDSVGRTAEALEKYDEALDIRLKLLGEDDLRVAETMHNKGAICCENGDCDEALNCLEEALRIRREHFGDVHESCADTMQWLGNVMREWEDHEEAMMYFREALRIKKILLGKDHEDVGNTVYNLAVVLDDLGKYDVSMGCYKEALRIRRLNYGSDDAHTADYLQCMGNVSNALEQQQEAHDYFKESIEIREQFLQTEVINLLGEDFDPFVVELKPCGEETQAQYEKLILCYEEVLPLTKLLSGSDHIHVANLLERMGAIYTKIHDWDNAVGSYQGAIRVRRALESTERAEELTIASLFYNKGRCHAQRKEYAVAKACYESSLKYRIPLLGDKSIDVALALYGMGFALGRLKRHQQAIVALTECLNIFVKQLGENHIRCGDALHWIGRQHASRSAFDKALVKYTAALRVYKTNKSNKEMDPRVVAATLHCMGNVHERQRHSSSGTALKCYEEEIRLLKSLEDDGDTASSVSLHEALLSAANVQAKRGQYDESMENFRGALEHAKLAFGDESEQVATALEKMGVIHAKQGENELAKAALTEAYSLREVVSGRANAETALAAFKLGCVLDKLNEQEAAGVCFEEVIRIQRNKLGLQNEVMAKSLFKMGENYAKRGKARSAIDCFQDSLRIRRRLAGDDSEVVSLTLHRLANAYVLTKSSDKALLCYKEAHRVRKDNNDTESREMADLAFDMGQCYDKSGNFVNAGKSYVEALQIYKMQCPSADRIPQVLVLIATTYEKREMFAEASECLSEAIAIMKSKGDDDDEHDQDKNEQKQRVILTLVASHAKCLSRKGDYKEALACYEDHITLVPNDAPDRVEIVSDDMFQMGNLCARMQLLDMSIEHFTECLEMRKKEGDMEEGVAKALFNMAVVQEKKEDHEAAIKSLREALKYYKMKQLDPDVASTLNKLGRVQEKIGHLEEALECYTEATELRRSSASGGRGKDLALASTLHDYASVLIKLGTDDHKAQEILEECITIRSSKASKDDLKMLESLHLFADLSIKKGEYQKAIRFLDRILAVRREKLGNDHKEVGGCLHSLGLAHTERGEIDQALEYLTEGLAIRNESFGEDSLETGATLHILGRAYRKKGQNDKAADALVRALRIRKVELGNDAFECAQTLCSLGEVQEAMGKNQEALNCYNEGLRVFRLEEGRKSLSVAEALLRTGQLLIKIDKPDAALRDLREALSIHQKLESGPQREADVLLSIGKAYAINGRTEVALEKFKASLEIRMEEDGEDHASVAHVLVEIGELSESQGGLQEALGCYNKSIRIYRKRLGDRDVQIAKCLNKIAAVYTEEGDFGEALGACMEALAIYKEELPQGSDALEVGHTQHQIGGIYDQLKRFDDSLECFTEALRIFEINLGEDDLTVALARNNMGINYARRKNYNKAIELCSEALRIRRLHADEGDQSGCDVADTTFNLASIYDEAENYDKALKLYGEALAAYRESLGDDDIEVANCLKFIGIILVSRNDFDEAQHTLLEAVRIYKAEDSIRHNVDLATVLYNLGLVYEKRKDLEKALNCHAQCLRIRKVELGESDKDIAHPALHIGSIYLPRGKVDEALVFLNTALELYGNEWGKESSEYADALSKVAEAHIAQEEYDLALSELHVCLGICKKKDGMGDAENSEKIANILSLIGMIHNRQVEYEDAMKFYSGALKIRIKLHGKNHEKVATTMMEIGNVLEDWGDSDEALDCYSECLRIQRLGHGDESIAVAETLNKLGGVFAERGEHEHALKSFDEALTIYKSHLGDNAVDVGHTWHQMGKAHDALEQHDESLHCFTEALRIFRTQLGEEDLTVALALNNVGVNYARRKEYAKAIELCSEALRIRKVRLGEGHLDIADGLYNLANILDEWRRYDQALKFYSQALAIYRSNLGDDDIEVANCLQFMGTIFLKENEHDRALTCFNEAVRIYRQKDGGEDELAGTLFYLGRIFAKRAEFKSSLDCFMESYQLRKSQLGENHVDTVEAARFVAAIERKLHSGR